MAMLIEADLCTSCGDCEPECPTAAISVKKGVYVINAKLCTECDDHFDAPRCEEVCPVDDCIVPAD